MYLLGEFIAVFAMIYLQKNIKNKENVVTAPQTQGIFRKYIG
jgi:hypothetical protein